MGTSNNMYKLRNSRKYDSKIKRFQVTRPTRKGGRVEKSSTRVQPESTANTKRLFFLAVGRRPAASEISIQFHMVSYCSAIKCHLSRKLLEIQPDLRIGELMQICIHWKDNSPKSVNHCLTLKEGTKVKSVHIRRFPAMISYRLVSHCRPLGVIISKL